MLIGNNDYSSLGLQWITLAKPRRGYSLPTEAKLKDLIGPEAAVYIDNIRINYDGTLQISFNEYQRGNPTLAKQIVDRITAALKDGSLANNG